ncbi:MAG: 16S rRNA (uracil(1498)-N(3))-methyltransferase [Lachnospiraceae bacterium]|nr:16S rRNA (uracil(1498)-N(3))-methyltransferase [Lachnospiraceae bacterium]
MRRFFVEPGDVVGSNITITGDDVNHIKNVLRMKVGDILNISDGSDKEYVCEIESIDEDAVSCCITDVNASYSELKTEITLFQGLPKGDKLESIVQKTVELGVTRIVPVAMKRSVVKLDEKKAAKKVERMNAIALAAAKQSKRTVIPEVCPVMDFKAAVAFSKSLDRVLVPYESAEGIEGAKREIKAVHEVKSLGIFIGPEGGFDPLEIEGLEGIGARTITLGHRILRTETAGMAVMSILMFELEE